jgi:hypothetical protein
VVLCITSPETTFVHQLRAFVRAVRAQAPVVTDAADAIKNMRVPAGHSKAAIRHSDPPSVLDWYLASVDARLML